LLWGIVAATLREIRGQQTMRQFWMMMALQKEGGTGRLVDVLRESLLVSDA
jgi:hypothetical protein